MTYLSCFHSEYYKTGYGKAPLNSDIDHEEIPHLANSFVTQMRAVFRNRVPTASSLKSYPSY